MVGIPDAEAGPVLGELLKDEKIKIVNDKMHTDSVLEIVKQADYYRKMDQIEKTRAKSQQARA
jgi:hypothetical protein